MTLQTYIEKKSSTVLQDIEVDLKAELEAFEMKMKQKLEAVKRRYEQNIAQEIESHLAQFKFHLKHEKQMALFESKEKIMGKLYEETFGAMLQDEKFLKHYTQKFLEAIKNSGTKGQISVYGPQGAHLKKELEKQNISEINESKKQVHWGGMIFVSDEIEIDYNLDDLLEKVKETLSGKIVHSLFA